jgi:hypothetical protein
MKKTSKQNNMKDFIESGVTGKKVLLLGTGILLVLFLILSGSIIEEVDNGEIVIIQSTWTGQITIYDTPGPKFQNFGSVTHYKKSNQFWFSKKTDEGSTQDNSIKIRFNDGGHAQISGSVRWYMPTDHKAILKLHTDFQSQDAIEQQLIRQVIVKSVYMTGPLMSSKESSAEKRTTLLSYIEDQASNGVYMTTQKDVKIHDELMGVDKIVTIVDIVQDKGVPRRQEVSPCKIYNLDLQGLALNAIDYDSMVEKQIQTQQQAQMSIQTAIANSKKAEQDAITAELQGKAEATKAKWTQEVIKTKAVTIAEQNLAVQKLATEQADFYKKQQILEGEGEAEKQKLIMSANGALDQKLAAYIQVQTVWANALAKYPGAIVPSIISGTNGYGSGSGSNGMVDFMQLMSWKTAKDLSLDLSNKK